MTLCNPFTNQGTRLSRNGLRTRLLPVDDTLKSNVNAAEILNNSLAEINQNEISSKLVNGIFLNKESDTTKLPTQLDISTATFDSLQWIAQQCPFEFGPAVYNARMLLSFVDTTEYLSWCERILPEMGDRSREINLNETGKIQISPNPFDTYFTIGLDESTGTIIYGDVYDVLGQSIFKFEIPTETTSYDVDASLLPPGIYYLKLCDGNGIVNFSKIIK